MPVSASNWSSTTRTPSVTGCSGIITVIDCPDCWSHENSASAAVALSASAIEDAVTSAAALRTAPLPNVFMVSSMSSECLPGRQRSIENSGYGKRLTN